MKSRRSGVNVPGLVEEDRKLGFANATNLN